MIESIESLRAAASAQGTKRLAVACAQDDHVLLAVEKARRLGIAEAILVGCEQQIRRIAAEHALDLTPYRIIDEPDNAAACRIAVSLVKNGEADAVMKGLVDTAVILKAVLDKENGLRDAKVLSHVALFEVPGFARLLLLPASAMNMASAPRAAGQTPSETISGGGPASAPSRRSTPRCPPRLTPPR